MPLIMRRRILAASVEATPGTAETLDATDAAFNAFDVVINPVVNFASRQGQSALSSRTGVPGAEAAEISFFVELTSDGSQASPAWAAALLSGCGMQEALDVWTFDSRPPEASGSNANTLTIGVYEDGVLKQMAGAMGNGVLMFVDGEAARMEFTFKGKWLAATDVALIAPNYPVVSPIRVLGATFTIGGGAMPATQQFSIDLGNDVQMREDNTDATGFHSAVIVARNTVGQFNPEAALVATHDAYGDLLGRTTGALVYNINGGTNNKVQVAAPVLQFTGVQERDRNGLATDEINFQLSRSADAGDDELSVDFSVA